MPIIHRIISNNILDALRHMPVVFVNGPRQSGKSTLVQMLSKNDWPAAYITVDEPSQLGAAQANPETFLRAHKGTLILDEVQMVPELFRVIKMIVDEFRLKNKRAGNYLLTGSANLMALPELADALVGRMAIITLYPLSAIEISHHWQQNKSQHGKQNKALNNKQSSVSNKSIFLETIFANGFKMQTRQDTDDIISVIHRATFPEIVNESERARHQWFESYIMTILQRDVRQIAQIEKLGVLPNLLRVLASRAGGLMNEADIARAIGQNVVTTKNYHLILKLIFLTFDVKPWFKNIGKRLVKSAKGYIIDTSLLCHLRQIDLKKIATHDAHIFGHVLENFVATELLKQLAYFEYSANLLHFRTSDNKEVDFVLERPDNKLCGIEVKAKDSVSTDDFKGLKELQAQTDKNFVCGVILYRGRNTLPFGDKLWAVPVDALWS